MKIYLFNYILSWFECLLCATTLTVLFVQRQLRSYLYFAAFLAVRLTADVAMGSLLLRTVHKSPQHILAVYKIYFFIYWMSYALEAALLLFAICGIYRLAMAPLSGLQKLGMLMFRWIAAISVAVSIGLGFGPNVTSHIFWIRIVTQLQQTSSILTLCLLLFVCFAIRPLGLSYRSRIFGVSLGLGLLATTNLVASAWIVTNNNMYSPLSITVSVAVCASFGIWTLYLLLPEPKRRMIVLPTTSPFLRWNQISIALGDEPGFVAVGGIPPEMFAEAEVEIMTRASRKMFDFST